MGTQTGYNVPFLKSASLKKRKRKAMKLIKQIYKISKKGNEKKSCHLVPKVVIYLPFEGSQKYRSRDSSAILVHKLFSVINVVSGGSASVQQMETAFFEMRRSFLPLQVRNTLQPLTRSLSSRPGSGNKQGTV